MPSRHNRHGKVPGDDAVHRDHQWSSQSSNEEIGTAVVTPLPVCSLPPLSEKAVDLLAPAIRLIPDCGQVRDKSGEKEDGAHDEVCAHGEYIPYQGRSEVDPEMTLLRIREKPV